MNNKEFILSLLEGLQTDLEQDFSLEEGELDFKFKEIRKQIINN